MTSSMNFRQYPLFQAVFNAANLNGIGAVLMSLGLGSVVGSLIFLVAVLLGTWNKYRALTLVEMEPRNALERFLRKPSLTAQALMVAAAYNAVEAYFTYTTTGQLAFLAIGIGWTFGVLGDNALRM